MNSAEFIKQFEETIEGLEPGSIQSSTVLATLSQWDSLALLSTLALADAEYGVTLTGNEINACVTVGDIFELVKSKKV
jgi:acyl carrier protein